MEEAGEEPPYILLSNKYFTIYEHGRRHLLSGQLPPDLASQHGIRVRSWRAYQRRMSQEPPWGRAQRYQLMIAQQGFRSIRALARATGENHSRLAKVLKILELPPGALEALKRNSDSARIRARFTERRLRELVRQDQCEAAILREIKQTIRGRTWPNPVRVHVRQRPPAPGK
jgi:hypothetical protein